jgi:hypothetical protein
VSFFTVLWRELSSEMTIQGLAGTSANSIAYSTVTCAEDFEGNLPERSTRVHGNTIYRVLIKKVADHPIVCHCAFVEKVTRRIHSHDKNRYIPLRHTEGVRDLS